MGCIYTVGYYSAIRKDETAIYNNKDGPWEYYAEQNNQKKLRTIWFHSYVGYKTETGNGNSMVVTKGRQADSKG